MNIALIGLGKFGQAIASLVEYNGLECDFAERGKLLSKPADLAFLMVPSQSMRRALEENSPMLSSKTILVNGSKGIEEGTHLLAHEIVQSVRDFPNYYTLLGPSFAHGIVDKDPTIASLGYSNPKHVTAIKKVLETPYFRVEATPGYQSLELASALKNLYAILCGYARGIGFGKNTEAKLITLALKEFQALAEAMGYDNYDILAPGIVGDMLLTCTSRESRNYQFGYGLAVKGDTDPHERKGKTVEGFHTSHSIRYIARKYKVRMPLAELTARIIEGKVETADDFRNFLARR